MPASSVFQEIHEKVIHFLSAKIAAFVDAATAPKTTIASSSSLMKLHRTIIPVIQFGLDREIQQL